MANVQRIKKDLETLRDITEPCAEGTTRLSYTPEYRHATDYLISEMKKCGMEVYEDGIGMMYGNVVGKDKTAPKIISGSHLDTVRCSGYFDGQAGIICALEAARMLVESGEPIESTFQVVSTIMEEGARFPNLVGAKYVAGMMGEAELDSLKDGDGITLRQAIKDYGLSAELTDVSRVGEKAKAFIELHMEQGLKLEREKIDIGIVQTIYGCRWFTMTAYGAVSHPSTPMDIRKDTALASYKLISNVADIVATKYEGKATVTAGKMALHPNEINAIPSKAVFSIDFRSGDVACLDELEALVEAQMKEIGEQYRVSFEKELYSYSPPTINNKEILAIMEECCDTLGYSHTPIHSGAGHDTMIFANLWDTAMIFVPSKGGLTHCPEEWTDYENLAKGADLIYHAIRKIDKIK